MSNCAAFGCVNRSSMFHQIPGCGRNKVLRKKWLVNRREKGSFPRTNVFIYVQNTSKMNVMKET